MRGLSKPELVQSTIGVVVNLICAVTACAADATTYSRLLRIFEVIVLFSGPHRAARKQFAMIYLYISIYNNIYIIIYVLKYLS